MNVARDAQGDEEYGSPIALGSRNRRRVEIRVRLTPLAVAILGIVIGGGRTGRDRGLSDGYAGLTGTSNSM